MLLGDAQLEELTTLLQDLSLLEVIKEEVEDLEACQLGMKELEQVSEADFAVWVQLSLKR